MEIKAACIGTPPSVVEALSSRRFANMALGEVVGTELGVKNVLSRPAEYYVQDADVGPAPAEGMMGVAVRLTGASRDGRTPNQFHSALASLERVVKITVSSALTSGQQCQIFCVIMVDREIENPPGSGQYSSTIESKPCWVFGPRLGD